jgi:hypothetical protein
MVIASASGENNRQLLVLGLSAENVRRLQGGQPIRVTRESHGIAVPADLTLVIFTGETELDVRAAISNLIGPATVIDQKVPH